MEELNGMPQPQVMPPPGGFKDFAVQNPYVRPAGMQPGMQPQVMPPQNPFLTKPGIGQDPRIQQANEFQKRQEQMLQQDPQYAAMQAQAMEREKQIQSLPEMQKIRQFEQSLGGRPPTEEQYQTMQGLQSALQANPQFQGFREQGIQQSMLQDQQRMQQMMGQPQQNPYAQQMVQMAQQQVDQQRMQQPPQLPGIPQPQQMRPTSPMGQSIFGAGVSPPQPIQPQQTSFGSQPQQGAMFGGQQPQQGAVFGGQQPQNAPQPQSQPMQTPLQAGPGSQQTAQPMQNTAQPATGGRLF
jgi:hypothetical protein